MAQDVNLGGALRRRLNLARRKALGAARRRGGLVCIRIERRLRRVGGFGRIRWRAFEIRFDRLLAGLAFGCDLVRRRRGFGLERFGQRRGGLVFIRAGRNLGRRQRFETIRRLERVRSDSIGPAAGSPGPGSISRASASGARPGSNPSVSGGRSPSGGAGEKSASGAATASDS